MVHSYFLRHVYALECLLMSINLEFAFVWGFHSVKYKLLHVTALGGDFPEWTVSVDFSVCLGKFFSPEYLVEKPVFYSCTLK